MGTGLGLAMVRHMEVRGRLGKRGGRLTKFPGRAGEGTRDQLLYQFIDSKAYWLGGSYDCDIWITD